MKGEHHNFEDVEHVAAEHYIPHKGEHHEKDVHNLPKEKWKAEYHGGNEEEEDVIDEVIVPKEVEHAMLKPKEPNADDPRLKIPQGKTTAAHDHPIMSKEPVEAEELAPRYGEAYEHDRKEALRGTKESAGL